MLPFLSVLHLSHSPPPRRLVAEARYSRARRESRALEALRSESFDEDNERVDVDHQLVGNLWKKATSGKNSWTRRFVVLKDGFLMWYPERKKEQFHIFDLHPKVRCEQPSR